MKRTDITALFPDASDEQIKTIMDLNGADINKAKGELEDLRAQLAAATDGKELQEARDQISQLQHDLDAMKNAEAIRLTREKVAADMKIPASLLTGDTEEACAAQAKAILDFAKPKGYPVLPDGGSPKAPASSATRDKFAAWASENL